MGGLFIYYVVSKSERTARLLNSQAMNLDVVDVSSQSLHRLNIFLPDSFGSEVIPPDWRLSMMSPFLARSFRRTLHAKHEG